MTRIGNVDHIMVLLRQQLQRMGKVNGKVHGTRPGAAPHVAHRSAIDRIAPLAKLEDLDEQELERALIRALLTDEFGASIAEDRRFERVASEVHRIIQSDGQARSLLTAAIDQARSQQSN
ncbi:hypothetical protein [Pelagerythrobacter marensis]|uniref:Uncharacterized protein n=1 Tax=Pelagerythrobacter marensis TaxID=543877 RepID=A0A0G3XBI9_9SPHN|nr:hypothetical protein [Pelagerythrobacter marensis]AKM07979.1 hypothetical protein AM2010_1917 [Pelagerythrobacter marensis]